MQNASDFRRKREKAFNYFDKLTKMIIKKRPTTSTKFHGFIVHQRIPVTPIARPQTVGFSDSLFRQPQRPAPAPDPLQEARMRGDLIGLVEAQQRLAARQPAYKYSSIDLSSRFFSATDVPNISLFKGGGKGPPAASTSNETSLDFTRKFNPAVCSTPYVEEGEQEKVEFKKPATPPPIRRKSVTPRSAPREVRSEVKTSEEFVKMTELLSAAALNAKKVLYAGVPSTLDEDKRWLRSLKDKAQTLKLEEDTPAVFKQPPLPKPTFYSPRGEQGGGYPVRKPQTRQTTPFYLNQTSERSFVGSKSFEEERRQPRFMAKRERSSDQSFITAFSQEFEEGFEESLMTFTGDVEMLPNDSFLPSTTFDIFPEQPKRPSPSPWMDDSFLF